MSDNKFEAVHLWWAFPRFLLLLGRWGSVSFLWILKFSECVDPWWLDWRFFINLPSWIRETSLIDNKAQRWIVVLDWLLRRRTVHYLDERVQLQILGRSTIRFVPSLPFLAILFLVHSILSPLWLRWLPLRRPKWIFPTGNLSFILPKASTSRKVCNLCLILSKNNFLNLKI